MAGVIKKRGRRPEQHAEVKRRIGEALVPPVAQAAKDSLDRWISGEVNFDEVRQTLGELEQQVEALGAASPVESVFSAPDEVAWAALNYRDAAFLASRLELMAAAAAAKRDELQASLISLVATKPAMPLYARRFFDVLKAVGVGQDLLHPATKPKAERVKAALMATVPAEEDTTFAAPPIHQWSDLPRTFAGYRLDDTDERPLFGDEDLIPLPPLSGIEMYIGPDDNVDGEFATQETLRRYGRVVRRWAEEKGQDIDGVTTWGWALLLSYRLKGVSDPVPEVLRSDTIFVSPWDAGKAVRAVKVPVD